MTDLLDTDRGYLHKKWNRPIHSRTIHQRNLIPGPAVLSGKKKSINGLRYRELMHDGGYDSLLIVYYSMKLHASRPPSVPP
jgi:hypothetical protein